jgi:hypothetical protein
LNGKAPGARSILDDSQRQALRRIVEDGPIPPVHGVVRWRLLAQWVFEEFGVSISKQTLSPTQTPFIKRKNLVGRIIAIGNFT